MIKYFLIFMTLFASVAQADISQIANSCAQGNCLTAQQMQQLLAYSAGVAAAQAQAQAAAAAATAAQVAAAAMAAKVVIIGGAVVVTYQVGSIAYSNVQIANANANSNALSQQMGMTQAQMAAEAAKYQQSVKQINGYCAQTYSYVSPLCWF